MPHRPRSHALAALALLALMLLTAAAPWPGVTRVAAAQDGPGIHPVSGRRIASVMSHLGAEWLDRPEREMEERPDRALGEIGVKAGDVVADVGAGTGYYTVRLARRVGPLGRVYATDIQPQMLEKLRARLVREKIEGVQLVRATSDDTGLPSGALDMILLVDVYHELSEPQRTLQQLRAALKPSGRLVLVEFKKEDPRVPIRPEHKMSVAEARLEVEHEGFTFDRVSDVLPWQHVLVFRPAAAAVSDRR